MAIVHGRRNCGREKDKKMQSLYVQAPKYYVPGCKEACRVFEHVTMGVGCAKGDSR